MSSDTLTRLISCSDQDAATCLANIATGRETLVKRAAPEPGVLDQYMQLFKGLPEGLQKPVGYGTLGLAAGGIGGLATGAFSKRKRRPLSNMLTGALLGGAIGGLSPTLIQAYHDFQKQSPAAHEAARQQALKAPHQRLWEGVKEIFGPAVNAVESMFGMGRKPGDPAPSYVPIGMAAGGGAAGATAGHMLTSPTAMNLAAKAPGIKQMVTGRNLLQRLDTSGPRLPDESKDMTNAHVQAKRLAVDTMGSPLGGHEPPGHMAKMHDDFLNTTYMPTGLDRLKPQSYRAGRWALTHGDPANPVRASQLDILGRPNAMGWKGRWGARGLGAGIGAWLGSLSSLALPEDMRLEQEVPQ